MDRIRIRQACDREVACAPRQVQQRLAGPRPLERRAGRREDRVGVAGDLDEQHPRIVTGRHLGARSEREAHITTLAVVIAERAAMQDGCRERRSARDAHADLDQPVGEVGQARVLRPKAGRCHGERGRVRVADVALERVRGLGVAVREPELEAALGGAVGHRVGMQRIRPAIEDHRRVPLVGGNGAAERLVAAVGRDRGALVRPERAACLGEVGAETRGHGTVRGVGGGRVAERAEARRGEDGDEEGSPGNSDVGDRFQSAHRVRLRR